MSLSVNIKKGFKGFTLISNFETDEPIGLLGSSGCGKTLTLKCIAGLETPDEGHISLNGRILFDSDKKINIKPQERKIGYLFQNYALFPNMTVEENIGIGLNLNKKEKKEKVKEIIKQFHLEGLEWKYPIQLSGGQQQRVALARIIVGEPDALLFDEPFSALDTSLKEEIHSEVLKILKTFTGEVVMVTHSKDEAYKFCKNLAVIDRGKTIIKGKMKDIFEQPKVLAAARLIGVKNISSCKILSNNKVHAIDWDLDLEVGETIRENCDFIGIHPTGFQIVYSKEEKNTIECKIMDAIEELENYTVIFTNKNSIKNSLIYLTIRKEEWNNRKNKENLYLKISEKYINQLSEEI